MKILEVTCRSTNEVERIPESDRQFRATIIRTANTLKMSTSEAFDLLERGHQLYTALYINRLTVNGAQVPR